MLFHNSPQKREKETEMHISKREKREKIERKSRRGRISQEGIKNRRDQLRQDCMEPPQVPATYQSPPESSAKTPIQASNKHLST
jgi:hypothetical protein